MCNKEICRRMFHVPLGCFLCKKITEKHLAQLELINMMSFLSFRLLSTFYEFGCKRYICKKCWMKNRFAFTVGIFNTCIDVASVNFFHLLRGRRHQIWPWRFLQMQGLSFEKSILLNEHRFNSAQKYLLNGTANTKQTTLYLGY